MPTHNNKHVLYCHKNLVFAGEAYSREYYGFVHGAYTEGLKTGKVVADCVLGKIHETDSRDYACKRNSSASKISELNLFVTFLFFLWLTS
jgi:hypothetical protein